GGGAAADVRGGAAAVLKQSAESRFHAFDACSIASPRSTAWTPRTPLTICVMCRSTTRLASDKACRGERPYSSPISLTISTVAIAASSSRVRLKPNVNQPLLARRARGSDRRNRRNSGCSWKLHLHLHGAVERRPGDLPVA